MHICCYVQALANRPSPGKRGAFEEERFRDPELLQMYAGENIQSLKF